MPFRARQDYLKFTGRNLFLTFVNPGTGSSLQWRHVILTHSVIPAQINRYGGSFDDSIPCDHYFGVAGVGLKS